MPWREAAGSFTSGGLTMGFDLPTRGTVALAQAKDEGLAAKAHAALVQLAQETAKEQGNPAAIKQDEHRGVAIYSAGEAHSATVGKWLIFANKKPLVLAVLDSYHSQGETLAADSQFQQVAKSRPESSAAWLYVDLRVLRLTGILKNALNKKSDNPPAEILAGGMLGALPDAPYVTASLDLSPTQIKLTTSLPCNPKSVAKSREFYLGPDAAGRAPPLLATEGHAPLAFDVSRFCFALAARAGPVRRGNQRQVRRSRKRPDDDFCRPQLPRRNPRQRRAGRADRRGPAGISAGGSDPGDQAARGCRRVSDERPGSDGPDLQDHVSKRDRLSECGRSA